MFHVGCVPYHFSTFARIESIQQLDKDTEALFESFCRDGAHILLYEPLCEIAMAPEHQKMAYFFDELEQ